MTMRRLAAIAAVMAVAVLFAAPSAFAETVLELQAKAPADTTGANGSQEDAASQTEAPAPTPGVRQGDTLEAPEPQPEPEETKPKSKPKPESGGVTAKSKANDDGEEQGGRDEAGAGAIAPDPSAAFAVPILPSPSCSPAAVPAILVPIYKRAAEAYGLGPQGAGVLAAINEVETAFGTNLNVSSAGAVGWMQFMPATWAGYGVDANGDGVADPYDPEDAIHAAANYLRAAGAPADWYRAVFAYNHADWYVAEVLAGAACYSRLGNAIAGSFDLTPKLQVYECNVAKGWRKRVPAAYLDAFETAAARYDLGRRGVWALAAVATLESDFGRAMSKAELRKHGPLGLVGEEWKRYAVDGDGDGKIRRQTPADSAATLARMAWAEGGLRAGLFEHNHAKWYVDAVLGEAARLEGRCKVSEVEWALALPNVVIAPIKWENLTLSNELEKHDLDSGAVDPRIVGLLGAMTQSHRIVVSSLRSDHSKFTVEGGVSNHWFGRAMDIAAVDGVSCTDTAPAAPCAQLAMTLAALPAPAMPTELIYCFDVDGPGPAFARADHCDHVHAGYDG
jgi:hypothetical protein